MRFAWKPSWGGGEYKGIRMLWERLLSELSSSFKIAITRKCIEKGRVNKEKNQKQLLFYKVLALIVFQLPNLLFDNLKNN